MRAGKPERFVYMHWRIHIITEWLTTTPCHSLALPPASPLAVSICVPSLWTVLSVGSYPSGPRQDCRRNRGKKPILCLDFSVARDCVVLREDIVVPLRQCTV